MSANYSGFGDYETECFLLNENVLDYGNSTEAPNIAKRVLVAVLFCFVYEIIPSYF
jgi:hypothetical protein